MSCLPNSKTSFAKEQDREYILRFFAMHNSLTKLRPPLYRFLNAEMQEHQHMQQQKADEYAKLFRQTFHLVS